MEGIGEASGGKVGGIYDHSTCIKFSKTKKNVKAGTRRVMGKGITPYIHIHSIFINL